MLRWLLGRKIYVLGNPILYAGSDAAVCTPNHPSYPGAHRRYSGAISAVLAYPFPHDALDLNAVGNEAGESRLCAGIHFRSDIDTGPALDRAVANLGIDSAVPDIEPADARNSQTFATLALLLWRCRAILIVLLAGLEKFLKLTSKLWVQFLESNQVLFCGGFPAHFCKEHSPILIGLSHSRFELNSLIVMFKGFRIVLWALLTKRESEVIMLLGKVRIITDRLFELNLGGGELLGVHKRDALVVNFETRTADLLSRQVALNCRASPTATSASTASAHCSDYPGKRYTNTDIEAP